MEPDLKKIIEKIYKRTSKLLIKSEYEKCLKCECYFGLLYYLKDFLSEIDESQYKEMEEEILLLFNKRKESGIHQCLGCEPCPPDEWTAELIRELNANSE